MKIAVSIPDNLFQTAEELVKRLGISRSEFYRRALTSYIRQQGEETVLAALNEVYGADSEAGRLDPVLAALQEEVISRESW